MKLKRIEIVSYNLILNQQEFDWLRSVINSSTLDTGNDLDCSMKVDFWNIMNQYDPITKASSTSSTSMCEKFNEV